MSARRPFWKSRRWKSIGFCLWPPSTCIWNLTLKFQSKPDLCSGNHVVYRQTDGQTDGQGESSIPPSNFVGRGYNNNRTVTESHIQFSQRALLTDKRSNSEINVLPLKPRITQLQGLYREQRPVSRIANVVRSPLDVQTTLALHCSIFCVSI